MTSLIRSHVSIPLKTLRKTEQTIEEVVFEFEVDDIPYYLVRCRLVLNNPIPLSPCEIEIARLSIQGFTNKEIGNILKISRWTVATHLRRIFTKLNITSKIAMVSRLRLENLL